MKRVAASGTALVKDCPSDCKNALTALCPVDDEAARADASDDEANA